PLTLVGWRRVRLGGQRRAVPDPDRPAVRSGQQPAVRSKLGESDLAAQEGREGKHLQAAVGVADSNAPVPAAGNETPSVRREGQTGAEPVEARLAEGRDLPARVEVPACDAPEAVVRD